MKAMVHNQTQLQAFHVEVAICHLSVAVWMLPFNVNLTSCESYSPPEYRWVSRCRGILCASPVGSGAHCLACSSGMPSLPTGKGQERPPLSCCMFVAWAAVPASNAASWYNLSCCWALLLVNQPGLPLAMVSHLGRLAPVMST